MSRIGNATIEIPKDVTLETKRDTVLVKGPKGSLTVGVPRGISVGIENGVLTVSRAKNDTYTKALHGLVRATIAHVIAGVTRGWTKTLQLSGVGYRAAMTGESVTLSLGFSHPVVVTPPPGISFAVSEGKITISGIDKQLVGQIAAGIRDLKKPEPYKGKGITYEGERIRKKAGKAAKAVGGTTSAAQ